MRCLKPIGQPFFELSEVDSSNNYAMQKVQAHLAEHGSTWFAHHQNAGKGQRGKVWNAAPSQNIMMSCVLEPNVSVDNQFVLNAAVAVACYNFFNKYAIDNTSIKWPNDIYWGDRKAGGILIENLLNGKNWKFSVVGIGININQTLFPSSVRNPVSLKQITGKTFKVIDLAKELCQHLDECWNEKLVPPYEKLMNEYNSHLYKLGRSASFRTNNNAFTGVVRGVNRKGELLIQQEKEPTLAYNVIEWVIP